RAQLGYEGTYVRPRFGSTPFVPTCAGCETGLRLPRGSEPQLMVDPCQVEATGDIIYKPVTGAGYTWMDLDCDIGTGVRGCYLQRWTAEAPPTPPNLNVAATYNYSDNPDRVVAAGDHEVTLA